MIFNNFLFIITIMAFFRAMQVDTSFSGNVSDFDLEFQKAKQLDTGFAYPEHNQFYLLGFDKIKEVLKIRKLPKEETMKNVFDIIYCDLVCGNMYVLYIYFLLCENINDYYVDESITRHMLASLFKINKIRYVLPFWHVHMYTLYSSQFRNETDEEHITFIKIVKQWTETWLRAEIVTWCRNNNNYNIKIEQNNKKTQIQDIIKLINDRQAKNDILLENNAEKNWASLKSIYLQKIIEEGDFLTTIIMTFGDQDEDVNKSIRDDIFNNYELAKNYYYYDHWVIQIREYLNSILNIIRTVALHLIRNHLYYADQYRKSNSSIFRNIDAGHSKIKELLLKNNFFKNLFRPDDSRVLKIVENLTTPNVSSHTNSTQIDIIPEIDDIMKNLSLKFVPMKSDTLFSADYFEKMRIKKEKLSKSLNMEDSNKVKEFQKKFDFPALSDNYVRIISYLQYLKTTFEEYNIETTLSYIETFKDYNGINGWFGEHHIKRTMKQVAIEL